MYRQAQLYTDFHNISSIVVLLSSTLNPFIYGLWGKDFRAALKSALCCIGCAPDSVSKNTSAPISNAE